MVKEFSEGTRAEAASEPSAMGGKDTVRFCIAGETKDQGGGVIGDAPIVVRRELAVLYLLPDRIEDKIGGDLRVGLRKLKQVSRSGAGRGTVHIS